MFILNRVLNPVVIVLRFFLRDVTVIVSLPWHGIVPSGSGDGSLILSTGQAALIEEINQFLGDGLVRLMEEISSNHLGCIKPMKP